MLKKKILLMGKSGAGKTSMRSIIFASYIARDTRRLGATIDVEYAHVKLFGNLTLTLWDCGGQDHFMDTYFAAQRDNIFRNVEVLIYVFDVESRELENDLHYYQSCLEAILQSSPKTKLFCLVHKMDLVAEDQRDLIFQERRDVIQDLSKPLECTCFRTSIWDETLYKAWTSIVYQVIPNVGEIEKSLGEFADTLEAEEVLLFERATFLVIAHAIGQRSNKTGEDSCLPRDEHRFEKISNIMKQFKFSCSKAFAQFHSMEVRNRNFSAFLEVFTPHTVVCVVMPNHDFSFKLMAMSIQSARQHFETLENTSTKAQPQHQGEIGSRDELACTMQSKMFS